MKDIFIRSLLLLLLLVSVTHVCVAQNAENKQGPFGIIQLNVTFVGFLPDKVHEMHTYMDKSENNDGKIVHYFDWNFQIGIKTNIQDFSPTINKFGSLYEFSNAKIDMYGYGQDGYKLKGSRLIAEE